MCGRFVLRTDLKTVSESFDIRTIAGEYRTGDNISPGQPVSAVIRRDNQNSLVHFRWGLIPSWAKDPSMGNRMFNARAETITEKPSFRNAFWKRRCLIIADGFYEWQKAGRARKPFLFSLKSGNPFGFAGLYESWEAPDRQSVNTCTIITTQPNELIKPIHDRMPVIVPADQHVIWMDPENQNQKELLSLLQPCPSEWMDMRELRIGGH
jgi:putative SOS response-associated peptidase YedK